MNMNSDDDVYLINSKIERWKIMVFIDTHLKMSVWKGGMFFIKQTTQVFKMGKK
jgi:hypothetical protein